MFNNILVYYVDVFLVISVIFTIFSIHSIFALLFLVLTFILSAVLLLLLNCEFFAFMFLIIYVGGIIVLFLFVIMLLNIKFKDLTKNLIFNNIIGFIFILFFCLILLFYNNNIFFYEYYYFFNLFNFVNWKDLNNSNNEIEVYSLLLYTNFIIQFLLIGFVLLLVLLGVVFFINNYLTLNFKIQNSFKQISINSCFFDKQK